MAKQPLKKQTQAVHGGGVRSQFGETSEAIFLTQGFVYDSPEQAEERFVQSKENEFIYSRYGNPTVRMFENRMALVEGLEDAFATASGMAGVNGALCSILSAGDKVVSSRALFGSCLFILENVLPRFGVNIEFVDGTDNSQWESKVTPDTKAVFIETVSNPTLEVIDLDFVSKLAAENDSILIADNALASPQFLQAGVKGADIVVYSATKHIDGQGRSLGGIVIGSRDYIRGPFEAYLKHTGGAISPFNAWIMLKGLETLELRTNRQADSSLRICQELEGHQNLSKVIYPHLPNHPQYAVAKGLMTKGGTVFTMDFDGNKDASFKFMNNLEIVRISNNFGDSKSLVTHPATTTHQRLSEEQRARLGITDGLVRVSVGLENPDDLLEDLVSAVNSL